MNDKLLHYIQNGFNTEAFTDENPIIRLEAYKELGFNEGAFDDPDILIRRKAHM